MAGTGRRDTGRTTTGRARRGHAAAVAASIAIVVLVSLTAPATAGAGPQPAPGCVPTGEPTNGAAAVEQLGPDGLAAAARLRGDEPDELRDHLLADPTLWLDSCGRQLYVDPVPDGIASPGDPALGAAGAAAPGPFPYDQTFALHSRPGSNRVIYLDFDGVTVDDDNAWAEEFNDNAAFTAGPFDRDGSPSTFSNAERDAIQEIWQRVAEDFAPFDVDVTTADPGEEAIQRSNLADQTFGTVAAITDDMRIGGGCGCSGIAYVDVFTRTFNGWFSDTEKYLPAWIFSEVLFSAADLAQTVSHEVGHNFGLDHDGAPGFSYYGGHGSWSPIMGNSFNRPMSQWSKGEYTGASTDEDDLAIISTGAPVVADDVGGTVATATELAPGPEPGATGVISTRADKDVFRFTANGATTITVTPAPTGPNLDIRADLSTSSGALITFSDPPVSTVDGDTAAGISATISQTLAPGTYHLQVDGVGFGNPNTGYSDYASLGAYTVAITTDVAAPGVPDAPAAPTAVAGDGQVQLSWVAPADNGSPIDRYVVTPYRAGVAQAPITTATAATSTTVTGLTNGVGYTFTIRAHNAAGNGPPSPPSASVVPSPAPTRFVPLVPGRVLDSRPGSSNIGAFNTPWQPGTAGIRDIQIGGLVGVPVDAAAVVLNVTVVNPSAGSFLQLWPTGAAQPTFGSSLNFNPGQIVPNAVTVKLGTGGKVRVFNAVGTTDVVIDVAGYYTSTGGAGFTPLTPDRVLDSRAGAFNVGPFTTPWNPGTAGIREVQIGGLGGVPADAEAVVLNVTVVNPTAGSFLQLWPNGASQPTFGSSLNFDPGQIVPNQVTVKLGTGGKVRVFNAVGKVDVIIDVSGYYKTGSGQDFYAVVPGRVLDSRAGASNIGAFATPWNAGTAGIRDVAVGGLAQVPADADGVVMNVTVVNPTALSFLQLWPTGAPQPVFGSSLNFNPGQIVPNAVTVKLGTGGTVRVFNAVGRVDVVADVAGYFA